MSQRAVGDAEMLSNQSITFTRSVESREGKEEI